MDKGFVQIYTGQGKGKTTAAFGLLIRALGRGLKVCVYQFLKSGDSGEILYLKAHDPDLKIKCAGLRGFYQFLSEPEQKEARDAIGNLFAEAKADVTSAAYDLVILDELLGALENELVSVKEVMEMLNSKAENTEVVITGRVVPLELAECAGLITDMRCVKHYFDEGRKFQPGIEY